MREVAERILTVFRQKTGAGAPSSASDDAPQDPQSKLVQVDFDRMLKGNVFERDGGTVRQMGVTVDGATRVITSGDYIDQKCYRALIEAGALRP